MAIVLALIGCASLHAAELAAGERGAVELMRDPWGTPHVFAETDEGAMYGLGYATAEDRLYQMNYFLRIMRGTLAEAAGDLSKRQQKPRGINSAADLDRSMRIIGYARRAETIVENLDPKTRGLLQAYSDGVNEGVRAHSSDLPPLFKEQGWEPAEWTPADCLLSWWHLALFFGPDGLRDLFTEHQQNRDRSRRPGGRMIGDDGAAVVRREDVSGEWIDAVKAFARDHGLNAGEASEETGPKFSHAWVIGGKLMTTGSATLVSDPQTPVWNPSMLYEFHITGKTFNARGCGVAGSPLILIGFNQHVAWGMSALGADQADLFRLETSPDHPDQYRVDGAWVPMTVRTETLRVKGEPDREVRVRETEFGPVVSELALDRRQGEEAALMRIPTAEKDRDTIQGAIAMLRAENAGAFSRALEAWRFPSANCIFGDSQGHIGYWAIGAIPVRSARTPEPRALQDGSSRSNLWQGTVPHLLLPHAMDPERGYLVTANHRPIQSFYTIPLGATTGTGGDTDRGWRIKQRIQGFLNEHEKFAPGDVAAIQEDMVNPVKKAILQLGYHIRDRQKANLDREAEQALTYLEAWYRAGAVSDVRRQGTELVNAMSVIFRMTPLTETYGGGVSGLVFALKTMTHRLETDPGTVFDEDTIDFVNEVLANAWESCLNEYGLEPRKWHERAVAQSQKVTMSYMEGLDGFRGMDSRWDLTRPLLRVLDGSTILAQPGQSYTQFVPLNEPDRAETILPIGISERPESPFRLTGWADWAAGVRHPAPLSYESVGKLAVTRITLSSGSLR